MKGNKSVIICIDLKSFYASVECVERGLDPFKTNLVVADPTRSKSTICLAITPAMKALGIRNRCRIHEIPENIEYITAMPRMQLYIDYSAKIYGIYLRYVSKEDIHVYSVDECFIDVTNYLSLYHLSEKEMALELMKAVMDETGITATAGVGTNLYLAKIAMDIVAKHVDDHIGILDEFSYREQLWNHTPLNDFWRIGSRTEKKLAGYGIHTMGDIAMASLTSEDWLYKMFGIDAELLIDHAWGYEPCTIADIKVYKPEAKSIGSGQVLSSAYSLEKAKIVVLEMAEQIAFDLFEQKLVSKQFVLTIGYDRDNLQGQKYSGEVAIDRYGRKIPKHAHGTINLDIPTSSLKEITTAVSSLYDRIIDKELLIRRLTLSATKVMPKEGQVYQQLDLFTDYEALKKEQEKERRLQKSILDIKKKYGKNAVLRGLGYEEGATTRTRNGQIGGHKA